MALSSRIQTITIKEQGGTPTWEYDLTPNNFDIDPQDVYWTGSASDEAIDGSLRQNFRGFRINVRITWEKITDNTVADQNASNNKMRYLLNDIVTSLATNKDDGVQIGIEGANFDLYVPKKLSKITQFNNQIARAASSLEFEGQQIKTSIPSYLEAPNV